MSDQQAGAGAQHASPLLPGQAPPQQGPQPPMMGSPSILGTAPVGVTSHRPNHVGQMLMTAPVPGVAPVDAPPAQRLERPSPPQMPVRPASSGFQAPPPQIGDGMFAPPSFMASGPPTSAHSQPPGAPGVRPPGSWPRIPVAQAMSVGSLGRESGGASSPRSTASGPPMPTGGAGVRPAPRSAGSDNPPAPPQAEGGPRSANAMLGIPHSMAPSARPGWPGQPAIPVSTSGPAPSPLGPGQGLARSYSQPPIEASGLPDAVTSPTGTQSARASGEFQRQALGRVEGPRMPSRLGALAPAQAAGVSGPPAAVASLASTSVTQMPRRMSLGMNGGEEGSPARPLVQPRQHAPSMSGAMDPGYGGAEPTLRRMPSASAHFGGGVPASQPPMVQPRQAAGSAFVGGSAAGPVQARPPSESTHFGGGADDAVPPVQRRPPQRSFSIGGGSMGGRVRAGSVNFGGGAPPSTADGSPGLGTPVGPSPGGPPVVGRPGFQTAHFGGDAPSPAPQAAPPRVVPRRAASSMMMIPGPSASPAGPPTVVQRPPMGSMGPMGMGEGPWEPRSRGNSSMMGGAAPMQRRPRNLSLVIDKAPIAAPFMPSAPPTGPPQTSELESQTSAPAIAVSPPSSGATLGRPAVLRTASLGLAQFRSQELLSMGNSEAAEVREALSSPAPAPEGPPVQSPSAAMDTSVAVQVGPGAPGAGGQAGSEDAAAADAKQSTTEAPKKKGIDPSKMPRPPTMDADPVEFVTLDLRAAGPDGEAAVRHPPPPPSTSRFVVRDRGNCGPRFLRLVLNNVPADPKLLAGSALSMDVLMQPLAECDPDDDPVPVVDMGHRGPPRCARCRAYINPFMRWVDGGRRFVCNMCGAANETPDHLLCPLSETGLPTNHAERPELWSGSVDFVASEVYRARPGPAMRPAHVFVIDVSARAVKAGWTEACARAIDFALSGIAAPDRALFGIVTYDHQIHFYALRSGTDAYQVVVAPDLSATFVPPVPNLLAPLSETEPALRAVLRDLVALYPADASGAGATCPLTAVMAAAKLMAGNGGHVHAVVGSRQSQGQWKFQDRSPSGPMPDTAPLKDLAPQVDMQALSKECADEQIAVSLTFLTTAKQYVDVATLSELPTNTGGEIRTWQDLTLSDWPALGSSWRRMLSREQGLEAIFRLRVSSGLKVASYDGAFFRRIPTDVDLPQIDADKTITATVAHDATPLHGRPECYFQAALLYTTPSGERRIRVHNLARSVTPLVYAMYKGADLDAYVASLARRTLTQLPSHTLESMRALQAADAAATLQVYRRHCAQAALAGQLILPDAFKMLPLFSSALFKCPAMRGDLSPDTRAAFAAHIRALPPHRVSALLYPSLFRIDRLPQDCPWLLAPPPEGSTHALPPRMMLSASVVDPDGVYLLCDGEEAVVHVGRSAAPDVVAPLLGPAVLEDRAPQSSEGLVLPMLPNPLSASLWALLAELERRQGFAPRLVLLRRIDKSEARFFDRLVEDRCHGLTSYIEHLQLLHKHMQTRA